MAGSMNRVTLLGNLARDPEIRSTSNGERVANLVIATSERWTDKASGERKEKTEFHRVTVFADRLVPTIERFLKKGSPALVEGSLQTRKYQDNTGQDKYVTEIVLNQFRGELVLLGGNDAAGREATPAPRQQQRPPQNGGGGRSLRDELSDEIPFVSAACLDGLLGKPNIA